MCKASAFKAVAPPVSVKDRWVGPREQVLNVPIAYQCYGPSKPSSLPSIESGFTPTAQWLAQERNWVRTCGSDGRRAIDCVGSPFSREMWLCSSLLMTAQRVAICGPREIRMVLDYTQTERGKCVCVGWVFPCRVYIDSNHHDSRI
jgi:hypothetical protein